MADHDSREGKSYATTPILGYLNGVHVEHDSALDFAFTAPSRSALRAIQVGPNEGKLLGLFVRLAAARKVVELGTLAGYSGIFLARALPTDGRLYTIDHDPESIRVAAESFSRAGISDRVSQIHADGLEGLERITPDGPFDLVFLDADKGRYDRYAEWAAANLRKGGVLVADNTFFFGKLLEKDDPSAAAVRRFHESVARDFESVSIPTPDGMVVAIKR